MRRIPGVTRVFRHERGTDVDIELQFHIDARIDDLVRAGLDREKARRVAHAEFGDVKRYEAETLRIDRGHARTTRIREFLSSVRHDLGYALRGLRRSPGFAAAGILTLALGIGANTAVWSITDALMRRPLPIDRPEELHAVVQAGHAEDESLHSFPRYERFKPLVSADGLAAMTPIVRLYASAGDQPEPVSVQLVSGNWFRVLRVGTRAGRPLDVEDGRPPDGAAVAVLSDGYWARRFGRDPGIIGSTIRVNGSALRVLGVAESGFQGLTIGQSVDLWAPITIQDAVRYIGNFSATDADIEKPWLLQDGISWLTLIARVPTAAAARTSTAIDRQFRGELESELPTLDSLQRVHRLREHLALEPIPRGFSSLRGTFEDPLRVLLASVGLVLLIACANLAGLFLARNSARSHESAIRMSLGARRSRLVRQVLTESLTIAALGGALSLLVAYWGTTTLVRAASSGPRPIPLDVSVDLRVIAFTLGISLLTGLLVGALPAMRVSQSGLYQLFRAGGRVASSQGSHRVPLGRALVIGQIALSLVLVVTAGIFVQTLRNLLDVDPGYDHERVITARIDVRAARYDPAQLPGLYERLLSAATSIPGARSASLSYLGVATGAQTTRTYRVPGRTLPPGTDAAQENVVTPDFFTTVGMPLVQGRGFTAADRDGAPEVAIVSESMARHFFGTERAVGARFGYDSVANIEVVGVVRDARVNALKEAPPRIAFYPLAQARQAFATSVEVRVATAPEAAIPALRAAIRQVDPTLPVREVTPLSDLLERGLTRERLVAQLAGSFGVLALLLAGVGLYGVIGYSVSRRTNEMGVRLALGASPAGVRLLILRESVTLSVAGVVIGLGLLVPVQGLIGRLVYGMSPRDPATVVLAMAVLLAVTAVAAFIPAWKASRIDPVDAIRTS
ncbi:MAG TPA: ABC transporter permease [Gemmatimonadaceae bacterium]|nr:ABC transporter permease [Gemmatimonadaceae bacterium]